MEIERSASSATSLGFAAGVSSRSKASLREGHDALLRARVVARSTSTASATPTKPAGSAAEQLFQLAFNRELRGLPDDDEGGEDTSSLAQDLFRGLKSAGSKLLAPLQALPSAEDLGIQGIQDELHVDMDCPGAEDAAADFDSMEAEGAEGKAGPGPAAAGDAEGPSSAAAAGSCSGASSSPGAPGAPPKLTKRQMMSRMQGECKKGGVMEVPTEESKDGKPAEEDPFAKQLKEQIADNKPGDMKEAFGSFMDDNTVATAIASMKESSSEGVKSMQELADAQVRAAKEELSSYFGNVFGGGSDAGSEARAPGAPAGAGAGAGPQAVPVPPHMRRIKKAHAKKKDPAETGIFSWLDGGLSPGQLRLRRRVRSFAMASVVPHVATWERTGAVPRTFMRQAGKEGLCAMYCSKLAGGEGMSFRDVAVAYEALGPAGLQAASLLAHQNMVASMMDKGAPLILKMTLTRALASGLALGTYAYCEPLTTLDKPDLTLSFGLLYKDQSGDYFFLNGLKTEVLLAGCADIYLMALRTHSGIEFFVLPKVYPGLFWLSKEDSPGGSFVPVRKLVMAMCIVRSEMKMKAKAVKLVDTNLDAYRLSLAAAAVGAAQVAVDFAVEYLASRPTPVLGNPALQEEVSELHACAASARMLVQRAANSMDSKSKSRSSDCAMAKLCAVRIAMDVASQSMNLLGGAAMTEVGAVLLKLQRDLAAYTLLGGDSELLTAVVYKSLAQIPKKEKNSGKDGDSDSGGGDDDDDPVEKITNIFGTIMDLV